MNPLCTTEMLIASILLLQSSLTRSTRLKITLHSCIIMYVHALMCIYMGKYVCISVHCLFMAEEQTGKPLVQHGALHVPCRQRRSCWTRLRPGSGRRHVQATAILSGHQSAHMLADLVHYIRHQVMCHHVGCHLSTVQLLMQQVKVLGCCWTCTHIQMNSTHRC